MNIFTKTLAATAFLAGSALTSAQAALYTVDAFANSSSGGTGVNTISLLAGQSFAVTVAPGDLWNAGALPRWSNADGLTGNLFATGTDESGQPAGTLIGQDFGMWTQGGLTAPYGTLVGQIGAGNYFVIGTNFSGAAANAGTLKLFYWDSNFGDNTQSVVANVSAVPEPATWAMMLIGFAGLGMMSRRRRNLSAA